MITINREEFLQKYKEHQEWLECKDKGNRLVWDFKINFKLDFNFRMNLSWADLSRANLDYSSWGLSCKTKNVILCKNLQAQLLGHVMNVSPEIKFTKEQVQFVRDNWSRFDEFCNDEIKELLL